MKAETQFRTTSRLQLALACAASLVLAACADLTAGPTSDASSADVHDLAAQHDRAGADTWNHNAGDVRVMSGTGRQVLR